MPLSGEREVMAAGGSDFSLPEGLGVPTRRGVQVTEGRVPVQESTGRGQEEEAGGTEEEREACFRRDTISRMLDIQLSRGEPQTNGFSIKINLSGCSPEVKERLTAQVMSQVSQLKTACEPYGGLVDVQKKCILVTLSPSSPGQLRRLLADTADGTLLGKIFRAGGVQHSQHPGLKVSVSYSSEEAHKLQLFLDNNCLQNDVWYTYCRKRRTWYWSPDNVIWYSCKNIPVTTGGSRPKDADIRVIKVLREMADFPKPVPDANCEICKGMTKSDSLGNCCYVNDDSYPIQDKTHGFIQSASGMTPVVHVTPVSPYPVVQQIRHAAPTHPIPVGRAADQPFELSLHEDDPGTSEQDAPPTFVKQSNTFSKKSQRKEEKMETESPSEEIIMETLQKAIYKIPINKSEVDMVRGEIQQAKYIKWKESISVNRFFGVTEFDSFASNLKGMMGMPEDICNTLMGVQKVMQAGDSKQFEVSFDSGVMDVHYVLFALAKRGPLTDVISTKYTMHAERAPGEKKVVTQKEMPSFWTRLFSKKTDVKQQESGSSAETVDLKVEDEMVKSYFRHKAICGFSGEGLIDKSRIKYV